MTNGWGPLERDRSNGEQAAATGHHHAELPDLCQGPRWSRRLGGALRDGGRTRFQSSVGVDDDGGLMAAWYSRGTSTGKAYDSGLMTGGETTTRDIDLDTTARARYAGSSPTVVTTSTNDHADWAERTLPVCRPRRPHRPPPLPPSRRRSHPPARLVAERRSKVRGSPTRPARGTERRRRPRLPMAALQFKPAPLARRSQAQPAAATRLHRRMSDQRCAGPRQRATPPDRRAPRRRRRRS